MEGSSPALEAARSACGRGDWPAARDEFLRAGGLGLLTGADDLLAAAQAAWWCGQARESVRLSARAHRLLLDSDRVEEAALAALDVAIYHMLIGQISFGSGWLNRAGRLLDDMPESPAHGYYAYFRDVERNLSRASPQGVVEAARRVVALSRRHDDPTLAVLALAGEGFAHAGAGNVAAGMALFDEVMAGLDPAALEPEWVGSILCLAVEVAYQVGDLSRMRLWLEEAEQWLDTLPTAVLFTGACRVYRALLWQFTGEWDQVDPVLDVVCRDLDGLCRDTSAMAWVLRGDVRLLTGDCSGAETAFGQAHQRGADPQPGLSLLQLDRGDVAGAEAAVRTALLSGLDGQLHRHARVLAAATRIALAAEHLDDAERHAAHLSRLAQTWPDSLVSPLADTASGAVALARGLPDQALPALRAARGRWQQLSAPYEAACTGLLLARCYRDLGDHATAELEAKVAAEVLDRLHARPAWPGAGHQPAGSGPRLTAREIEVLTLVADGLHNADIARVLVLSTRTVERHLSNIYGKLGIDSRAAATRYAVEHHLVSRHG